MGLHFWWGLIAIPYMFLFLFSSEMSFILSSLQVFFRDTQHLYGVFLTIWMYSTPILYPLDIIPESLLPLFKLNPLSIFIDFLREITLNDVSFNVKKGEILGIIGGNGAGKSTLLKLMACIMKPTKGTVEVDGTIAPMIELGTGFDFELSAIENIYLSGAVLGYSKKFIDNKVNDIFDFAEIWDFKDVPVKYFSSGMVARRAFSVSTIVVPDILIVDEILSVGDMGFQQKSYDKMKSLIESGTTVIYVSHDVNGMQDICDRVLWLDKGQINMIGNSSEVCESFINSFKGDN